jgi:hypothetical protein
MKTTSSGTFGFEHAITQGAATSSASKYLARIHEIVIFFCVMVKNFMARLTVITRYCSKREIILF